MSLSELPKYNYNPNQPLNCWHCKWSGTLGECKEERYVSDYASWQQLAGRDGWKYFCPECNYLITAIWNKVS